MIVDQARSRATGTLVQVIDNRDRSFEAGDPDDRMLDWATVCDDHGTYVMHETRKQAQHFRPFPNNWCEQCQEILDAREGVADDEQLMRVRVSFVVTVDPEIRREMAAYYGEPGLASRDDVKRWYESFGRSMDDDLSAGIGTGINHVEEGE